MPRSHEEQSDPKSHWFEMVLSELERANANLDEMTKKVHQIEIQLQDKATWGDINTAQQTLSAELKKLDKLTETLQNAMFGINKDNGLNKDLKDLEERVKKLETFKTKALTGYIIITGLIVFFKDAIVKLFIGM